MAVETEPLGVTGAEAPGATAGSAEHAVRPPRSRTVAAAVRENEIMAHLRAKGATPGAEAPGVAVVRSIRRT
ncbi:hypothetical protein Ani05nite_54910 [Amorphoplanes nipponensis]|uniref:Uncharacterized protein n=1 Tax=Actinoplanes nipponensis TaxID=135950 RepID=A0A919JMK6_9ACTN|nr:hypothetical protein Ani05nite_54910 [Actinoplanes nipponensis]